MSIATLPGVSADYRHVTKSIAPGAVLELGRYATLKWYDIAAPDAPVPAEIGDLARQCLTDEVMGGAIELEGLGFVILHRCGPAFYFLIVNTWANENEIWEQVFAKENASAPAFAVFPRQGPQLPTLCIWELGAVLHEQQAWRRYLYSPRDEAAQLAYLADQYEGAV